MLVEPTSNKRRGRIRHDPTRPSRGADRVRFDRSRFYRDKLERAGFAPHGAVGGLDAIEACR